MAQETSPIANLALIASSEVPVAASDGHVNQPKPSSTFSVWIEASAQNVKDGLDGSTEPIALKVPLAAASQYTVKLAATGSCVFPGTYPRKTTCRLVGKLKNAPADTPTIRSKTWEVTLKATPNPPAPESKDFSFEDFTIDAPIADRVCPVSFRLAGDFEWAIVLIDDDNLTPLTYDKDVRLELVWLVGPPLIGPSMVQTHLMRTATDLLGSYPIGLLRLFLPPPTSFKADALFKADFQSWWIAAAATALRRKGLIYNTVSGKSGFGVGCCGGSFDLEGFLRKVYPHNPADVLPIQINSFDLSALMQLACSLVVYYSGSEQLNTRWTCKNPFGSIKAGIPFGLSATSVPPITASGVNNPYFSGKDGAKAFETDAAKRDACNARAWLEVDTWKTGKRKIVDISWAVSYTSGQPPETDLGSRDLTAYATAHIDGPLDTLAEYSEDNPDGSELYKNDEFSTKQSGTVGYIARVGVYDVLGINEPRHGAIPAPPVPVPFTLRLSINTIIRAGMNPNLAFWGFNDASLKTMNIKPILVQAIPALQLESSLRPEQTEVRVVPGASRVSYIFRDMPLAAANPPLPAETGKLVINISVFDSLRDSYEAMAFELTKYESDISRMVKPINSPNPVSYIGHYSLQTPHSILCVRGNLFIEMTIEAKSRPTPANLALVANTMRNLDAYLSAHTVSKSQTRRPSLAFVAAPPTTAADESLFSIAMRDRDTLADKMFARTDRGNLVLPANLARDSYTHTFWVLKRTDKWNMPTVITIAGAHVDTFHPGFMDLKVTVAGP